MTGVQTCALPICREEIRAYDRPTDWRHLEGEVSINTLRIEYYLRDGSTLSRRYSLPLFRSRWDSPSDSYESRINRLMNSPQAALDEVEGPKDGSLVHISIWAGDNSTDTSGPIKDAVYAALLADAQAGRLPGFTPFYDQENRVVYLDIHLDLEFRYTWRNEQTGEQEVDYLYRNVQVAASMTATLQALLDAGVLPAELVQSQLPEDMLAGLTIPENV